MYVRVPFPCAFHYSKIVEENNIWRQFHVISDGELTLFVVVAFGLFFYFINLFILHHDYSSSSLLSSYSLSHLPLALSPTKFTSPLFLFERGQASYEYPKSLTCQVAVRFSTSPFYLGWTRQLSMWNSFPRASQIFWDSPWSHC